MEPAHEYLAGDEELRHGPRGNAILLGEVDEGLSTIADYFGGGNQLQALFNFPLNRYVFLGLAQESADPIKFGLQQLPTIPDSGQWVNFLRHHDELNLSRLTRDQREQVFAALRPRCQKCRSTVAACGGGWRPCFDGNQERIRLAYSVLFSLPGAPMLFYGEEIGMGENLELPGRLSVRAPMQWTSYDNGGFSTAPSERFVRPVLAEGDYGFERVNVATQRSDPGSLLNWLASLIRTRRECGEIGAGSCRVIDTGNDAVLGLRYDDPAHDSAIVVLNNLSPDRHTIELDLTEREIETATSLFADRQYGPINPKSRRMRIDGYGFLWLRLDGIY